MIGSHLYNSALRPSHNPPERAAKDSAETVGRACRRYAAFNWQNHMLYPNIISRISSDP